MHCCWGALSLDRPHPAAAVSKSHEGRHERNGREKGAQHREHESSSVPIRALSKYNRRASQGERWRRRRCASASQQMNGCSGGSCKRHAAGAVPTVHRSCSKSQKRATACRWAAGTS